MITSWRFLVVAGGAAPERDLAQLKANEQHRRQIYEKLDITVEKLNAKGQPFAETSAVPGTNSIEVIGDNRTAYRVFLKRSGNTLVVIGIGEGGDRKSTSNSDRKEIQSRLTVLQGDRPRLVKARAPQEEVRTKRSPRSGGAGRKQAEQARGNLREVVFSGPRLRREQRQGRRSVRQVPNSMTALLQRRDELNKWLGLAEPAPGTIHTRSHHRVGQEIAAAKADGRDIVSERKQELKAIEHQAVELGLRHSPLPQDAPKNDRINAGVRVLVAAESATRGVALGR